MKDRILFFSTFIKNPKEIGSVTPSSRFLTNKILGSIDFKNAKYIAEYGAGTGRITIELLNRSGKDAKILCFEVNKKFCRHLREKIKDDRLIIINDSAKNVKKHLKKLGIGSLDYVISGLPLSSLDLSEKCIIMEETKNTLKDSGKFIIYQFLNNFKKILHSYFPNISMKFVPLNIPPCFVYVCGK